MLTDEGKEYIMEAQFGPPLDTLRCPECLIKSLCPYKPDPKFYFNCLTCNLIFTKEFVYKYNESKAKEKKITESKCPKCSGFLSTYNPSKDVYTCDNCQLQFTDEYIEKFYQYKNSLHVSGQAQDVFTDTIIQKTKKPKYQDALKESIYSLINDIKRLADYRTKDDSEVTDEQLDKLFESIFIQTDEVIAVHYQGVEFNSEKTEDPLYSTVHPFDPDYADSPFPDKSLNDKAAEKLNQKLSIFDTAVDKKALEELLKFADKSLIQEADKLPADENGMVIFEIKSNFNEFKKYSYDKNGPTFADHIKECLPCALLAKDNPNILKIGNF